MCVFKGEYIIIIVIIIIICNIITPNEEHQQSTLSQQVVIFILQLFWVTGLTKREREVKSLPSVIQTNLLSFYIHWYFKPVQPPQIHFLVIRL